MADEQKYFFLNMINAGVTGLSKKAGHEGWLELDTWDFQMNQAAQPNTGAGTPTKTSATGTFSFSIKHNGPRMFKLASMGSFIKSAITFDAERAGMLGTAGGTSNLVYFQLIFNKVALSMRSLYGDDGQKTEHVELAFESVQMVYKPVVNGAVGSAITKTYDAKQNTVI